MAMDWVDKYGRKSFPPHGRRMRMKKDYDETWYRPGAKRDISNHPLSSSPASIQEDFDQVRMVRHPEWFGEGSIYSVDKHGSKGRKSYHDLYDTRIQRDGIDNERGYTEHKEKQRHEDIGPYLPSVGSITYGAGYTDEERKKLPKFITHWAPEATKVSSESTTEKKYTRGKFKHEKQRQKLIGLLEKQGL